MAALASGSRGLSAPNTVDKGKLPKWKSGDISPLGWDLLLLVVMSMNLPNTSVNADTESFCWKNRRNPRHPLLDFCHRFAAYILRIWSWISPIQWDQSTSSLPDAKCASRKWQDTFIFHFFNMQHGFQIWKICTMCIMVWISIGKNGKTVFMRILTQNLQEICAH